MPPRVAHKDLVGRLLLILAHARLRHNLQHYEGSSLRPSGWAEELADELIDVLAIAVEDAPQIGAQNMIKECRVDRAEVGSDLEVAVI